MTQLTALETAIKITFLDAIAKGLTTPEQATTFIATPQFTRMVTFYKNLLLTELIEQLMHPRHTKMLFACLH